MHIGDWTATKDLNELFRQLRELDLLENVAELDAFGFTIVPPEKVRGGDLVQRLAERVLDVAEARTGTRPDMESGVVGPDPSRAGDQLYYLLFEDPVFQEALLNPTALGLISYLLGNSCRISSMTAIIKGPGGAPLKMHADMQNVPAPFPSYAQVANATYLLTDYTKENGALCFTPGSHRYSRQPVGADRDPLDNPKVVPVEAPSGSLVVWHGNTWHGAFPRENPGLRLNLIMYFCRVYIREQEAYFQHLDPRVVETLPERLRTLLGEHEALGWREEGPQFERFITRAGTSQHG